MHILEPIRKLNTLESIIIQEGLQLKASTLQKATSFNIQDPSTQLIPSMLQVPFSQFYYNKCKTPTDCEEQPQADVWKQYKQLFSEPLSKNAGPIH
jgi:hypothetical protein